MTLNTRRLGSTGLYISPLCLGTMTFADVTSESEAARMLALCDERGINFIDTADGDAGPEAVLGSLIQARRQRFVLATKVFHPTGSGPNDLGLSKKHIITACEASLRRLRTDYIDLYQAHTDDPCVPLEETLAAFDLLVRQGKVRYVGASNYTAWRLNEALWTSSTRQLAPYVCVQCLYNLVERDIEAELLPMCRAKGVGVLAWSPLAGGWLSGKYRRPSTEPRRLQTGEPLGVSTRERRERVLETLLAVSAEIGIPAATIALRWVLERDGVAAAIVGARTAAQLEHNLACLDIEWPAHVRAVLESASRPNPTYPAVVEPFARQLRNRFD